MSVRECVTDTDSVSDSVSVTRHNRAQPQTQTLAQGFMSMSAAVDQGSKFMVAMVANATMFCHLLPGFSSGSKHLLLP